MKILVCDDDETMSGMIRFKLSRENLGQVTTANNGKDFSQRPIKRQEEPVWMPLLPTLLY